VSPSPYFVFSVFADSPAQGPSGMVHPDLPMVFQAQARLFGPGRSVVWAAACATTRCVKRWSWTVSSLFPSDFPILK